MSAQTEWTDFAEKVGLSGPDTPDIQRQEMRRAFFAGQWAMFTFQMKDVASLSDNAAERLLQMRVTELEDFFKNFRTRN